MSAGGGPAGALLRPFCSADLDRVMAIEQASQPTPWSINHFRDCLRGGYQCVAACVDGEPVAFMILSSVLDEMHLLNLAVAPAWQRHGLALWMLGHALSEAGERGMSVMYLEVRQSNRGARKLYRQLGFVDNGRRKGYYGDVGDQREDAILMMALI